MEIEQQMALQVERYSEQEAQNFVARVIEVSERVTDEIELLAERSQKLNRVSHFFKKKTEQLKSQTATSASARKIAVRLVGLILMVTAIFVALTFLQPWVLATIPGVAAVGVPFVTGTIGFLGGAVLVAILETVFPDRD